MKYIDFEAARAQVRKKFDELQGPIDHVRAEEKQLTDQVARCWILNRKYLVVWRPDFIEGYLEVRGRYDYRHKPEDGIYSPDPRAGMLSPDEMRELIAYQEMIARWRTGETPELPPSNAVEP